MHRWLSKRINSRNTGAFSFQNAFFYLQFADDDTMYDKLSSNPQIRASLVTQKKTRRFVYSLLSEHAYVILIKLFSLTNRRQKLHPQKQRSKYICKPEAVIEAGNHFVWEFCPGRGALNVPSSSAILHRKLLLSLQLFANIKIVVKHTLCSLRDVTTFAFVVVSLFTL